MQIERTTDLNALVENRLPDGSRVILDSTNGKTFALNVTAGAAWDACTSANTLSEVAEQMKCSIGDQVTVDIAEQAILQLEEQNLVKTSGGFRRTRRSVLVGLGTVALPVVVGLTLAEQKAYARRAGSFTPPPPPPPVLPPRLPSRQCGLICQVFKNLGL
jgi:hypothetical protein